MPNSPSRQLGKWIDTKTVFLFRGRVFLEEGGGFSFFFLLVGFAMHRVTDSTNLRRPGCHNNFFFGYNVLR